MNIPGLARARQRIKSFANRFRRRAVVLLYHRVGDVAGDPQLLSVGKDRFEQHMEYLSRSYPVLSLGMLAETLAAGEELPDQCVAVTFDDGYADNLSNAKPILEQHQVPATVFVTTGYLDQEQEFWWDELERIFLHPSTLPARCHLRIGERVLDQNLADAARYTECDAERHRAWNVTMPDNPTVRHKLYRDLCVLLRRSTPPQRTAGMRTLRAWSGIRVSARDTHRCLSSSELKELGSGRLVEVGAHTVSHPVLANLPVSEQRGEICESREQLARILGKSPRSFAYPFGTKSDYTSQTAAMVREAGFALACANVPDVVTGSGDLYHLPRVIVRDWTREQFAGALKGWFAGKVQCC
jgi:peptidoglycan/xylan/chitin deacetylase (PgdA/CDA1 family)